MTREIADDFARLNEFLSNYKIKEARDASFQKGLRKFHLRMFSMKIVTQRLIEYYRVAGLREAEMYAGEVFSDLLSSLLNWSHGSYKASNIMMRSSIENFAKLIIVSNENELPINRKVSKLLDLGKDSLNNPDLYPEYDKIRLIYSELCEFVHTNEEINMQLADSLGFFPHFKSNLADQTVDTASNLIRHYLYIISVKYKPLIVKLHHRDFDGVMESLSKTQARYLMSNE